MDSKEFTDKYTKKEVNEFKIEYSELMKIYEGVKDLNKIPDAIFIIDAHCERTALLEAKKVGIPVISIIDTNGDPDLIDYPIPGNDDAIRAVTLLTGIISRAVVEGKRIGGIEDEVSEEAVSIETPETKESEEGEKESVSEIEENLDKDTVEYEEIIEEI